MLLRLRKTRENLLTSHSVDGLLRQKGLGSVPIPLWHTTSDNALCRNSGWATRDHLYTWLAYSYRELTFHTS